jgi:hypothetical protein
VITDLRRQRNEFRRLTPGEKFSKIYKILKSTLASVSIYGALAL